MSYIGTGVPNRALTSADIAQGAVTLDDISFTDQPTNLNILGTIDKHTMRLTDGVTVTGDVTLSDNLILAKLSDDGNAITLTDDGSTRTITGTGSIEASTLAQTPNSSLTGMTGELGSTVTGSTAITGVGTLTSGNFDTVFPFTTATASSVTREHYTIGKLKIMILKITSDSSANDWGSSNMPRYYNTGSITYPAFSSRPSIWAIQETGAHDAVVNGVYDITTTGANWISASESRSASLESTAHTFLIIGEA